MRSSNMGMTERPSVNSVSNDIPEFVISGYNSIKSPGSVTLKSSNGYIYGDGALRPGGALPLTSKPCIGLLLQYFSVGFLYGTLPKLITPFLSYYLNTEGATAVAAFALLEIPWTFKFFYGMLSDACPIFGYRRRPYMVIGFTICSVALLTAVFHPLPDPYFPDPAWRNIKPDDYTDEIRSKISYSSQTAGAFYVICLSIASFAYMLSDATADALVIEYTQREPLLIRGRTQAAAMTIRTLGMTVAQLVIAIGLNSPQYGGGFHFGLTVPHVLLICGLLTLIVIPVIWSFITEEICYTKKFTAYMREIWNALQMRIYYQIVAFDLITCFLTRFESVAYDPITAYWVKATSLSLSAANIVSQFFFALTTVVTAKYGLHWNWRVVYALAIIGFAITDLGFSMPVVFGWTTSAWLWFGVQTLQLIPASSMMAILHFMNAEIVGEGNEGAMVGLLTTACNLGTPLAMTASRLVDSSFAVWNEDILNRSSEARRDAAYTFLIVVGLKILALAFIGMLPRQRLEVQAVKANGGSSKAMGIFTITYFLLLLLWAIGANFMSMFDSTRCLAIIGGCKS